MADRDLLNKLLTRATPETPNQDARAPAAPGLGKLGVRQPAREIGHEPGALPQRAPLDPANKNAEAPPAQAPPVAKPAAKPAFRAAYFNRDIEATTQVNLRAKPLAALRGEEGATDLKKVVLPQPAEAAPPGPELLGEVLTRMQGEAPEEISLAGLVGRQSRWSSLPSIRPEHILARLQQLQRMVADRKAALARFAKLAPGTVAQSETLSRALQVDGEGLSQPQDVEEEGNHLIGRTQARAQGLQQRLAKVLRSKL